MSNLDAVVEGDALISLPDLPEAFFRCCVTSPPYWKMRDSRRHQGALGNEGTVQEYVSRLVEVFTAVRRVLSTDGTLWLNLGDTYANGNLVGVPWLVVFALKDAGWILRADIVWAKPNPMPESVSSRPTRAHEFLFLLVKSGHYFYDAEAIKEQASQNKPWSEKTSSGGDKAARVRADGGNKTTMGKPGKGGKRNARTVWTIPPRHYHGTHDAVFPPELPRRCILAGSRKGDAVLDPFAGSGTTCMVAKSLGRRYVGIEIDADSVVQAEERIARGI